LNPDFDATLAFSADIQGTNTGINDASDFVSLTFNAVSYGGFYGVIAALNSPDSTTGDIRIGLHVQGIDGGGSDSVVVTARGVPDGGATVALLGLSISGLGLARRFFAKG
jgi:hypothetical protein